jgi:hypothetical protein
MARKIWIEQGRLHVKLFDTVVFEEHPESITIDSGGWITISTSRAISQGLEALALGQAKFDSKAGRILVLNKDKILVASLDEQNTTVTIEKAAFKAKSAKTKSAKTKSAKSKQTQETQD